VKLKKEKSLIVGKMTLHEPKIPTEPMASVPFILQPDASGQLEFLWEGTLDQLIKASEAPDISDADYSPEGGGRKDPGGRPL
jgi:hypothetical protein